MSAPTQQDPLLDFELKPLDGSPGPAQIISLQQEDKLISVVLDRQFGIAIRSGHHCNQILNDKLNVPATCRASFYPYNTHEEIDLLIEGIHHIHKKFNK